MVRRRRNTTWFLAAFVGILAAADANADTLHVPSHYATIQSAINAAVDGDEVVIADGTYTGDGNRDLDFNGKAITVRSASSDPASCIINCQHQGYGMLFYQGEGPGTLVDGLTIADAGYTYTDGGAVVCNSSDPTIVNCAFTGCLGEAGGAIVRSGSSATFTSCTITNNWAYVGGGIACRRDSAVTMTRCTIEDNSAQFGGGISCGASSLTLVHCDVIGNAAEQTTSTSTGGAIDCWGSDLALVSCSILGNYSEENGGGIHSWKTALAVSNCTFSGNTAALRGGGTYSDPNSSIVVTNSILWNDTPQEIYVETEEVAQVCYSIVQGTWPGEGNIDADPLFVDPDGPDDDPNTWADNDYRLSANSPGIDAGSNADVTPDLTHDLDSLPRITDGDGDDVAVVDMGAYERPAVLLGDLNCDGAFDFADINQFVDRLAFTDTYNADHPGCIDENADINADGVVSFGDINPFIELLIGT